MPVPPDQLCGVCQGLGRCLYEERKGGEKSTVEEWYNALQRGCDPAEKDSALFVHQSEPTTPAVSCLVVPELS